MKLFLTLATLSLCAAFTATAAAQTAGTPPVAAVPEPTRGFSRMCFLGAHPGIADEDARKVADLVCRELRTQWPTNTRSYAVEVSRTDAGGTLSLAEVARDGTVLKRRSRPIESIHATTREAPFLARDIITPGPGEAVDWDQPSRMVSRWYGGQTLAADGATLALLMLAPKLGQGGGEDLAYVAAATYCLGAPLVHLGHDNSGRAALSFGMRTLALGGTIAAVGSNDDSALGMALLGMAVMSGVIAVDSSVLARDEVPRKPPPVQWSVSPVVGKAGASLSVGGVF